MRTTSHANFFSPRLLKPGSPRLIYTVLVPAAIAIRIAITGTLVDFNSPMLWEFGVIASNLANTGVFALYNPDVPTAFMPPAFPLIIAGIYELVGQGFAAHLILAALLLVFNMLVPLLIGWLAQLLWGPRAGLIAWVCALFWPPFLSMSGRLHPIPIYLALQIAAFALVLSTPRRPWYRAVVLGLVLGLYINFRFEAPIVLVLLCWVILRTPGDVTEHESSSRTARFLPVVVSAVILALSITPWLARNQSVFEKPLVSTSSGFNLFRGHHAMATGTGRDVWPAARNHPNASTTLPTPPGIEALSFDLPRDEVTADRLYRSAALQYIKDNPRGELTLVFKKVFYFLIADFTHPYHRQFVMWVPSLLLLVVGLVYWLRTGTRAASQQALWLLFLMQLVVAVVFFVLPRYRIAVDFVPLLFAAAWLSTLTHRTRFMRSVFADTTQHT